MKKKIATPAPTMPPPATIVTGFKAFNDKLQCVPNGKVFQYEVGKTYEIEGKLKMCENGLHFCKNPLDIFEHYPPTSRFAEVEAEDVVGEDDATKHAARRLTIKAEVSMSHILGVGVKFILDRVDWKNAKESNTGYRSASTNTGHQSASTNTGHQSASTNTGHQSASTNTGYQSASTNTGYRSASTNTGYRSASTNTGHQSASTNTGHQSASTNTGYRSASTNTGHQSASTNTGHQSASTNTGHQSASTNTGKEGCAISLGIEGRASGALGCWLTLAEWKQDPKTYAWHRIDVQTRKVDGVDIKPDTFYKLANGVFVEHSDGN